MTTIVIQTAGHYNAVSSDKNVFFSGFQWTNNKSEWEHYWIVIIQNEISLYWTEVINSSSQILNNHRFYPNGIFTAHPRRANVMWILLIHVRMFYWQIGRGGLSWGVDWDRVREKGRERERSGASSGPEPNRFRRSTVCVCVCECVRLCTSGVVDANPNIRKSPKI